MTLTQQFLVTLVLPLAFLLLVLFTLRRGIHRQQVTRYWLLTLVVSAVWASNLLSFYGGITFTPAFRFTWQVVGRHMLSFLPLCVLLTTTAYITATVSQKRLVIGLGFLLWAISVGLDPAGLPYSIADFTVAAQTVTHFSLWSSVWVTSWLLPILAAWLLTRQAYLSSPGSVFRNLLNYWMLTIVLFGLGGSLALLQQPGQPIWQEVGALGQIIAALVGSVTLTSSQLPDLRLAVRRLTVRLAATAVIFGLTWLALWILVVVLPTRGATDTSLDLILVAAGFAIVFIIVRRYVNRLIYRLLLPEVRTAPAGFANQSNLTNSLFKPDQLGEQLLQFVRNHLSTESGQIYLAEDGMGGRVIFRPLVQASHQHRHPVIFQHNSPFISHLRRHPVTPLAQYDIDNLGTFTTLEAAERESLTQWQHDLFVPLLVGEQLVGLLALDTKYTGEPYHNYDIDWLTALSGQAGLLLLQAQNLTNLRQINHHTLQTSQTLALDNQHLHALIVLYRQFGELVSPDLRHPLTAITRQVQEAETEGNLSVRQAESLGEQASTLRGMFENLISMTTRLQKQHHFQFKSVHLDEVVHEVVHNLNTMAEGRRVRVEVDMMANLPPICGDAGRLAEAIHGLIHNGIKFNKIGGTVRIVGGTSGDEVYVHVEDNGVGMPPDRLDQVWEAFRLDNKPGRYTTNTPSLSLLFTQFIAHAHGGRVDADSVYGSGSTFSIYLPLVLDE